MNCTICQEPLDPVLEKSTSHPNCFPFDELDNGDPFTTMLKTRLMQVILWAQTYAMNPRSKQVAIGPSELGSVCDRRLGYRVAEVPPVNTEFDPWPMIMGTAMHSWLEEAFTAWRQSHSDPRDQWMTETKLELDTGIQGTSDLYDPELQAVVDWKGIGPDGMRKLRKDGTPSVGYQVQAHLYGYGFTLRGLPVRKVCLVFLPRAGWLKDMYVWCQDYDENIAVGAIYRMYGIATQVMNLDILKHSHRWEDIPATPSNDCAWCPWYQPGKPIDIAADHEGCPGR